REQLVKNADVVGRKFLEELRGLAAREPILSNVRGRGLFLAFDLPDRDQRERFYQGLFELGLLAIRSGERTIRFRTVLYFPAAAVDTALNLLNEQCLRMRGAPVPGAAALGRQ